MPKGNKNTGPFIGALLRLCWQRVRRRIFEAVRAAGFTDLDEAHFAIFSHPAPNGVRPSELARRLRMSRQAANYLIAHLEAAHYLERRTDRNSGHRLVYVTKRGWQVIETIYATLHQLQTQWADEVGHERFADFMNVLRHLSAEEKP